MTRNGKSRFAVGARVVYPFHGVARILRRERRTVRGATGWYLVLDVPQLGWGTVGGMTVWIPEATAEDLGLRDAVSVDEAGEVLDVLATRNAHVPVNWSRRFKNHQEKLRSGDIYQCAEVVRNLANRMRKARLSAGEQAMYTKARRILVSELAVSWDVDEDAASTRVDNALDVPAATL